MKRLLLVTVAVLLIMSAAYATDFQRLGGYTVLLNTTSFDNVTTSVNTASYPTIINSKTAFFVTFLKQLANQSATLVPQISQDDSTYINMIFYDIAGGATYQTAETLSANSTYYFWLPSEATTPYTRLNITALNTTVAAPINMSVYIVGSINPGTQR